MFTHPNMKACATVYSMSPVSLVNLYKHLQVCARALLHQQTNQHPTCAFALLHACTRAHCIIPCTHKCFAHTHHSVRTTTRIQHVYFGTPTCFRTCAIARAPLQLIPLLVSTSTCASALSQCPHSRTTSSPQCISCTHKHAHVCRCKRTTASFHAPTHVFGAHSPHCAVARVSHSYPCSVFTHAIHR